MFAHVRSHLLLVMLTLLLCVVAYPLVLLVAGQTLFPRQAQGDPQLLAQAFTGEEYFWPRPSGVDYNAMGSGGSNLAASNPKLRERVVQQIAPIVRYRSSGELVGVEPAKFEQWLQERGTSDDLEPVTADMVTTSGSGLDPHISVRNAKSIYQLDRVARKRASADNVEKTRQQIVELIDRHTLAPLGGMLGEPIVNVQELNRALDQELPRKP